MQVILLEKIRNLGDLGELVNVKAGYGRNYLIPGGQAVSATSENILSFETRRAELEAKAQEKLTAAEERAARLNKLTINIDVLASDEGKLYGSVAAHEIQEAITNAGETIEKREISMPEGPIHSVGEYDIVVQVHSDVLAQVKIIVAASK